MFIFIWIFIIILNFFRFVYVPGPHTSEIIGDDYLFQTLIEWNIDGKLFTITLYNCFSNDSTIKIFYEKNTSDHSLMLEGGIFYMRCTTHILNIMIKDGLVPIIIALKKIKG